MAGFVVSGATPVAAAAASSFATGGAALSPRAAPTNASGSPTMLLNANPVVDDYMARSVRRQYIQIASPTGVSSRQCIEAATFSEALDSRVAARHASFRARQLPISMQVHNLHETKRAAIAAAHGCSHEESRAVQFPTMAAAYVVGQAESQRACSRYIQPASKAEKYMAERVEMVYKAASCPGGTYTQSCTDGQASGEAEAARVRAGSVAFRSKQYSAGEQAGAAYAAKKWVLSQKGHDCSAEEATFLKYPSVAGSMRPDGGSYARYVQAPGSGVGYSGKEIGEASAAPLMAAVGPKTFVHLYAHTHAGSPTLIE